MTSEVRDERWSALRIELQEAHAHISALEFELALLRQIVAAVETCGLLTICVREIFRDSLEFNGRVTVGDEEYRASTWQAALHAAAEQVRREAEKPSESSSNP